MNGVHYYCEHNEDLISVAIIVTLQYDSSFNVGHEMQCSFEFKCIFHQKKKELFEALNRVVLY